MYRFDLEGYSFGSGTPLDITWCGYNYTNVEVPMNQSNYNRNESLQKINTITQYYKGTEKRLVLEFGPINRYCNGFSLYYQGHYYQSHIQNGLKFEEYKIVVTK